VAAPFFAAIKGTTSGTPGTGAFTPSAASTGFRAWSLVPTGWIGLVRYEDGTAWELSYSYWNGTTLSRGTNQLFDSSTASVLTLTSAATAAMVVDAADVQPHLGTTPWHVYAAIPGTTALGIGGQTPTMQGTSSGQPPTTTNYLTEQYRNQLISATTANAQAGWSAAASAVVNTTAGRGGFEWVARFGASGLPTGPRLFAGMTSATFVGNTGEPSAFTANYACFAKDSTDTNIQLLVNSNAGSGTKTDTGIPLTANGWYEASIWCEPGSNKVYGLLIRLDTGDIWFGSTTTDVPASLAIMLPNLLGSLNGTNTGTAFTMAIGSMAVRSGM
jgi:hypothetical protein